MNFISNLFIEENLLPIKAIFNIFESYSFIHHFVIEGVALFKL